MKAGKLLSTPITIWWDNTQENTTTPKTQFIFLVSSEHGWNLMLVTLALSLYTVKHNHHNFSFISIFIQAIKEFITSLTLDLKKDAQALKYCI